MENNNLKAFKEACAEFNELGYLHVNTGDDVAKFFWNKATEVVQAEVADSAMITAMMVIAREFARPGVADSTMRTFAEHYADRLRNQKRVNEDEN